jgi:hypothetical protein
MPRVRIVTAGAIFSAFLLVSGMATGSAAAQTATNTTPGKPIQLLQLLHASQTKAKPQTKRAAKSTAKTKTAARSKVRSHSMVAERKQSGSRTHLARTLAPDSAGPAVPSAPPPQVATATPAPQAAVTATEPVPGELIVGGHTVQVASPDDVNELDLAANDAAPPASAAASTAATSDPTEAEPKSDFAQVATGQPGGEVGSTSWMLQVMAALGGAVAAGSVAWFLIGSTPQRIYG